MRYPLWVFLFIFVLPPFTLHAALSGKARFIERPATSVIAMPAPEVIAHRF